MWWSKSISLSLSLSLSKKAIRCRWCHLRKKFEETIENAFLCASGFFFLFLLFFFFFFLPRRIETFHSNEMRRVAALAVGRPLRLVSCVGAAFTFLLLFFFLALERFSHSFLVVGSCFGVGVVILDLLPPNCCQWKTGNSFALVLSSFESKTKVWFVIIFVISREKKKRRLG